MISLKASYVQRGETIDYRNTEADRIEAGDVVVTGDRVCIAGCCIEPGQVGSLHTVGVFSFPKAVASTEFNVGDYAFYTEDGITPLGDIKAGWVVEPSLAADENVLVKI